VAKFKPRLRIASGGRIDFEISASDWRRIETEYGRSLAPSIRIEVFGATQKFLDAAEFEKTAPYASEAIARIKSIRAAAREFRAKIMRRPPEVGGDADFYAIHLICRYLNAGENRSRDALQKKARDLDESISRACDLALEQLKREMNIGFRQGDAWNSWIRGLTSILSKRDLPTEVRKDADKSKAKKPSPFVALVRELQWCLPKEDRRASTRSADFQANIALSTAIVRARSARRVK
jgi:hypothetical protein